MAISKRLIVQCCVCKRIRDSRGDFLDIPAPKKAAITHTYCPACYDKAMSQHLATMARTNQPIQRRNRQAPTTVLIHKSPIVATARQEIVSDQLDERLH